MAEQSPDITPESPDDSRGKGHLGELLIDPRRQNGDMRLVSRAVKQKWPIKAQARKGIVNRLLRIVAKEEVSVATKNGTVVHVEEPADANAIAAARVLAAMVGQNVAQNKAVPAQTPTTINVGVSVDNRIEQKRADAAAIAKQIGSERFPQGSSGG